MTRYRWFVRYMLAKDFIFIPSAQSCRYCESSESSRAATEAYAHPVHIAGVSVPAQQGTPGTEQQQAAVPYPVSLVGRELKRQRCEQDAHMLQLPPSTAPSFRRTCTTARMG